MILNLYLTIYKIEYWLNFKRKKHMKNILEVCLSPDLGGLEIHVKDLTKFLSIKAVLNPKGKLKELFQKENIPFETIGRYSFIKLSKIIDENDIDIVHLNWTKDIPIVVFAKLLSKRKPKIVQTRHMTMTRFKNDFYHKFLYKNIDMIICVTKALGNQINKFIPENIRPEVKVLYLGAKNVKEFAEDELKVYKEELNTENSFIVGFVGRINEAKGQYLLIEALKRLKVKNLDIKVYFVGHAMNEEYLNSLKQKVKSYNLEKEVNFLGFVNEPSKFMQICDVIVAASKNETFGLVVIEAMKNQTAVIASKSGGFLEIIDDGLNGLLFENENVEDLCMKIEKLYSDKKLKDTLALEAKRKVDLEFDSEIQFEKLKEIFKGV